MLMLLVNESTSKPFLQSWRLRQTLNINWLLTIIFHLFDMILKYNKFFFVTRKMKLYLIDKVCHTHHPTKTNTVQEVAVVWFFVDFSPLLCTGEQGRRSRTTGYFLCNNDVESTILTCVKRNKDSDTLSGSRIPMSSVRISILGAFGKYFSSFPAWRQGIKQQL